MAGTNAIFWGFIFGAIGLGYITYGTRQKKAIPLLCGILLGGFTWFVRETLLIFLLGVLFMAVPFVVKRIRG